MAAALEWIEGGGVTSPAGWRAGGSYAGIKTYGEQPRLDVGILVAGRPCAIAGIFTRNRVFGPAVAIGRLRVASGHAQAIVANSGCANTATGERGYADALRMAELTAARAGIAPDDVCVASTGVIGRPLPMDRIAAGIAAVELSEDGGGDFSRAIMTTDRVAKQHAVRFNIGGTTYTVGGTAKGSGMVHPHMATVFCFLTTDAPAEPAWLQRTLKRVGDVSINMVDVDMDTSTSDTMLLLANGAAGGAPIAEGHAAAGALHEALEAVSIALARDLARDGEGAQTLIEVTVEGAASVDDARAAARTVASSPLVKTMVTGRDPNLGRVLMAAGRSGATFDPEQLSVWIGDHCAFERGVATELDLAVISREMGSAEVGIRLDLGAGDERATAWGCDLTTEYVRINADYTT